MGNATRNPADVVDVLCSLPYFLAHFHPFTPSRPADLGGVQTYVARRLEWVQACTAYSCRPQRPRVTSLASLSRSTHFVLIASTVKLSFQFSKPLSYTSLFSSAAHFNCKWMYWHRQMIISMKHLHHCGYSFCISA